MKKEVNRVIMGGTLALLIAATGSLYAGPGRDGDGPRQGKKGNADGAPWMKDGTGEKRGEGPHGGPQDRPSREEILKKFDANKDGKLDDDEKAAMQEAMEKRAAERKAKMLEKFDADGDGKLNEVERAAARAAAPGEKRPHAPAEIIEKFDKDGDGKLNEKEREAAHAAREDHMQERRKKMLEKFDADGNGELNDDEKTAMREFMKEHGPKKGPRGERGPRGDGPKGDDGTEI